jgi:hypothetical protein
MQNTISLNGQARPTTGAAKQKGKAKTTKPKSKRTTKGSGARRKTAVVLASVAAGLVFLSVYHLTCAVSTLTGSPLLLAVLLAVGIDLGLVASEVAEMVAAEATVQKWSRCYMLMATAMSMVLNSYEFAAHAPQHWFSQSLSIGFGLILPPMVFVLARQAGGLWGK